MVAFNTVSVVFDDECSGLAWTVICQYLFPLCNSSDEDTTGLILNPFQEMCLNVSENTCRADWELVRTNFSEFKSVLPNCNEISNGIAILKYIYMHNNLIIKQVSIS